MISRISHCGDYVVLANLLLGFQGMHAGCDPLTATNCEAGLLLLVGFSLLMGGSCDNFLLVIISRIVDSLLLLIDS